ncbi:MAG: Flp pilus assembly complex ATPase component TadA [Candidatus Cloacimonetes bacterium]|nr:Flp pilus assembly complex ATPase component TadA [Candidatus Cloacimonadota bacterium]
MRFSFSADLERIHDHVLGVDRIAEISDIIASDTDLRLEARSKLDEFLMHMIDLEASDADFGGQGSQGAVWYRIHGAKTRSTNFDFLAKDDATALICSILTERQIDAITISHNADFSYRIQLMDKVYRFRADAYMDMGYLAINFRFINPKPFDLQTLGFPPQILRRFDLGFEKKGLILVTGITGSGKSTTLDAIINSNNHKNEAHIVIIGSPIEYFHSSEKCLVRHREIGRDTISFKDGSIEALRQDPDIIVIGEMRDPETIMTALEITDSGHKVFSTLHTGSAVESVHRIVAECPTNEQNRVRMRLADTLSVVISQKLVPSVDGRRVLAKEILSVTPWVSAAIINSNIGEIYQMINEGKEHGMITLEQDLMRLLVTKQITKETAISHANSKKRLMELMSYYKRKM